MKNRLYLFGLMLFLLSIPGTSFSQEQLVLNSQMKPALLVIDIQNAYLKMMSEKDKETAMPNINKCIELFRSHGYPIIRIYHFSKEYGPKQGTDQFEFPASVSIKPDDPKVIKTYPDGFNKTDLDKVIKEKGCNTLFLCGLSATGCVLATWIGAQNYDYPAVIIKDAIISPNSEFTDDIAKIFGAVSFGELKSKMENSEK